MELETRILTLEREVKATKEALAAISGFEEVRRAPVPYPVVSERGVAELGWA